MYSYTADELFDGYRFLPSGSSIEVASDGTILSLNSPKDFEKIHCQGLLMPGLINAHCHLELSYLKGKIQPGTGLVPFLTQVVQQRNAYSDNEIQEAITSAELELMNNGVVAVGDICNGLSSLSVKRQHQLHYHSFIECFGLNEDKAKDIVRHAIALRNEFSKYHPSSLALHAPYSISDALITLINEEAKAELSTIHNQESMDENRLFAEGKGAFVAFIEQFTQKKYSTPPSEVSSVQTYLPKLEKLTKLILVHNTYTSEADIAFIKNQNKDIYFCLCPKANFYIEGHLPEAALFYSTHCPVIFGTDSLASNTELHLLQEIMLIHEAYSSIPLASLLHSGTMQGAKALGFDQHLGSFEPQKKPGIVQVEQWKQKMYTIKVLHRA